MTPPSPPISEMKDDFEAWMRPSGIEEHHFQGEWIGNRWAYTFERMHIRWQAWQAAAKLYLTAGDRAGRERAMYAKTGEQELYLVWEMAADRPTLAVICTTDDVLARYVAPDRKTWRGRNDPVFVEKVMADHLYGAHDAAIAVRLLRHSRELPDAE